MELSSWFLSLSSVVVGVVLGAFVTLWRRQAETKWGTKFEAYQRILSAIDDIRFWAEETYASNLALPTVSTDDAPALATKYRAARRELWRFVHVGGLIISDDASAELEGLLSKIAQDEFGFWDDSFSEDDYSLELARHAERVRTAIDKSLPRLLEVAKRDIR